MKDRSQLAMLIGLVALILVVLNMPHAFNFGWHLGAFRGVLPWVLMAAGFWFFFGSKCGSRGCCYRRNDVKEA